MPGAESPIRPRPPVSPFVGVPLAPAFGAAVAMRNAAFDRGLRRIERLPIPVISVGNISVGGTGKSPMVRWVVEILRQAGAPAAIAMRGYQRKPGESSDEQAEHEALAPETPIAVGPDRAAALRALLARRPEIRAAVLDDGFQRRSLHRDFDLVLIDATRSPFADRLLPAGWLREPPAALVRAHAVVITRADRATSREIQSLRESIGRQAPHALLALASHAWSGLVGVGTGAEGERAMPVEWLRAKRVHVACAIGNPSALLEQVRAAGADVVSADIRRDHAAYADADVRALVAGATAARADAVLTTEKDWVKIAPHAGAALAEAGVMFVRPRLRIEFTEGEADLRAAILSVVSDAPAGPERAPVLR